MDGVGEQIDQASVPDLSDVGDRPGPDLAAEQHPADGIGDDQGLHGVHPALAGHEPVASGLVGGRSSDTDLGGVDESCLPRCFEVGDHVRQGPKPQARRNMSAAIGEQRADLTDRPGDRRTRSRRRTAQNVRGIVESPTAPRSAMPPKLT